MLKITTKNENEEFCIVLEGQIDLLSARDLEHKLGSCLECTKPLTLDFAGVDYISSAGLRAILAAQQYLEEKDLPDLKILNVSEAVYDIFTVTGFDKMLEIERAQV